MKRIAGVLFVLTVVALASSTEAAPQPTDHRAPMCKPHWAKCKFAEECCSKSCSGTCNA